MNPKHRNLLILCACFIIGQACLVPTPGPKPQAADTVPAESGSVAATPIRAATEEPTPTQAYAADGLTVDTVFSPSQTPFPEDQMHAVMDADGSIEANIPAVWTDAGTTAWTNSSGKTIGTIFTASTNLVAFRSWQVEGVMISVSRHLDVGYVQLIEQEYHKYKDGVCTDSYNTYYDFQNELYRGKEVVLFHCAGVPDSWLSILTVVNANDPSAYVMEVVGLDLPPLFGDEFRNRLMHIKVHPEKLP